MSQEKETPGYITDKDHQYCDLGNQGVYQLPIGSKQQEKQKTASSI